MSAAIVTVGLTKRYKDKAAVENLNLSVKEGELFSLLGVNGAGKTTAIKMLACLSSPTAGDAFLLGDSIIKNPSGVKEKINISPQETAVARNLTVRENLELIAGIYGSCKKEAQIKAGVMIERFKLSDVASSRAKTLSGGMQRRLSIAMALITRPKILFLDEPTLGLDVLARRELWEIIRGLRGKITVILTTHYMEEAAALSDTIGIMSRGRLIALGSVAELIEQTGADHFEDAFVALVTEGEKQ